MATVSPFAVNPVTLNAIHSTIEYLRQLSRYTTVTVPAADFPAWCAALGVDSFYAHRVKNGHCWVGTRTSQLVDITGLSTDEWRMLSVTCDTPPAPWVEFPRSEGDRRYMFRYELHNETESK